jgi:hypothetical protein
MIAHTASIFLVHVGITFDVHGGVFASERLLKTATIK